MLVVSFRIVVYGGIEFMVLRDEMGIVDMVIVGL